MILHGKNLIIKGSGNAPFIAAAKSCTINVDNDMEEVASATQGSWREFMRGRRGWEISLSHLLSRGKWNARLLDSGPFTVYVAVSGGAQQLPFDGFIDGSTITIEQTGSSATPTEILYDTDGDQFLSKVVSGFPTATTKYYNSWASGAGSYEPPREDVEYVYNSKGYYWDGSILTRIPMITGSALIRKANIAATVGNLAQGSIVLQGTGPLSEYTPSS